MGSISDLTQIALNNILLDWNNNKRICARNKLAKLLNILFKNRPFEFYQLLPQLNSILNDDLEFYAKSLFYGMVNDTRILNLSPDYISRKKHPAGKRTYLFINPPIDEPFIFRKTSNPFISRLPPLSKGSGGNIPLGLLQVASKIYHKGNNIMFMDCAASLPKCFLSSVNRHSKSEISNKILSENFLIKFYHCGMTYTKIEEILRKTEPPDEIFVTCTLTYHNVAAHRVIEICKKIFPTAPITFGGIYATLAPEEAKKSKADRIYAGKYPETEALGIDYTILGYCPNYQLIKGTYGCPNNCSYCAVHKLEGREFRFRSPENVFSEIFDNYQRYPARTLKIWDSNLLCNFDHYFGKLLDSIQKKHLDLSIQAHEGLDYRFITPEIARKLKTANFDDVRLALEDMNPEFSQENLGRKNDIVKFEEAVDNLKTAGFEGRNIKIFLLVGLPNQKIEEIINNIKYVWSLGCNAILFAFTPIPGTKIFEKYFNKIANKHLYELHPYCLPFVEQPEEFIELLSLNYCSFFDISQRENFKKFLTSNKIISLLSSHHSSA